MTEKKELANSKRSYLVAAMFVFKKYEVKEGFAVNSRRGKQLGFSVSDKRLIINYKMS